MSQRGLLVAVQVTMGASVARVLSMTSSAESGEPPQTVVLLSSCNPDVYGCL